MPAQRRRSTRLATRPTHGFWESELSFSEDEYMGDSDLSLNGGQSRVFEAPSDEPIQLSKRVQNAKQRKGSGYVPRAQNCFMIFRNAMIKSRILPTSDMNNATISKVISNTWAAMPESEKNEWREKARVAKFQHSLQYPDYRYRPKHKPRKKKTNNQATANNQNDDPEPISAPIPVVSTASADPTVKPIRTRGPRTKKMTTRGMARDKAQSEFVTQLVLQGIKGEESTRQIREWAAQWEADHPLSEFPDDPILDAHGNPLMCHSRPHSTCQEDSQPSLPGASQLMWTLPDSQPSSQFVEESQPAILAPIPSPAAPTWISGTANLGFAQQHRRSLSQPPDFPMGNVVNHAGAFFHEEPIHQSSFHSGVIEDRAWLGRRRSVSVGALQYAEMLSSNAGGRRPSAVSVLYPQAFQGGNNDFLPYLPPSFAPEDPCLTNNAGSNGLPEVQQDRPVFNPSFSFTSPSTGNSKPVLPMLQLAPDQVPYAHSTSTDSAHWSMYPHSAGPLSAVSGPPSTIYSGSQGASPESIGQPVSLPPVFDNFDNFDSVGASTHNNGCPMPPDVVVHQSYDCWPQAAAVSVAGSPSEELHGMDDYLQFNPHAIACSPSPAEHGLISTSGNDLY